ncbi:unnamed protein product [Prorocentrum cordatum]|uniref:Uncharacterized protein n=1 Tax=Prorocentrum cordatum TaxID=2364126 RepID=A0ABN9U0L1_9DINO|nr:unnamed protein product [Polarella glacialis]
MRARRQPCLRGCLPLWAAACAAARASAEETLVEVSLIQLSAHAASEAASEARESAAVYEAVAAALRTAPCLTRSTSGSSWPRSRTRPPERARVLVPPVE